MDITSKLMRHAKEPVDNKCRPRYLVVNRFHLLDLFLYRDAFNATIELNLLFFLFLKNPVYINNDNQRIHPETDYGANNRNDSW